jgi:hypothetical protein
MKDVEREWRIGYARQALSDLSVYELFASQPSFRQLPACHRLHYLQMCLEKTAKAFLWQSERRSERSEKINTSHKFIEKILPQIFRAYWIESHAKRVPAIKQKRIKQLCQELDFLAPATDDAGQRPDNCEYPWLTSDAQSKPHVIVPALHQFPILDLLDWTETIELIKCVKLALPALCQ